MSLLIIMCSVVFLLGNQTELQGIDVEVHILRSEMNNCVCQVDKLRKEFVELKEEIEASRFDFTDSSNQKSCFLSFFTNPYIQNHFKVNVFVTCKI